MCSLARLSDAVGVKHFCGEPGLVVTLGLGLISLRHYNQQKGWRCEYTIISVWMSGTTNIYLSMYSHSP
jgi:hypothetical protein